MGWQERIKKRVNDPMGRKQHIVPDMKEIHYHKNPDGSLDQTPRILLVFPVFSHVLPEAFASFVAMSLNAARFLPKYKFDVMLCERELLHMAMNRAVEVCIKNPWYIGMVAFDDDCLPPANTVTRFVAHFEHGIDIVAAYSYMRRFPHTTTVGLHLDTGPTIFHDPNVIHTGEQRGFTWQDDVEKLKLKANEHGLIEVDFCGMPAMFISRRLLAKMKTPHFMHEDKTGAVTTHDIYFCNKARDMGYKVHVDMTLECGHIGPAPIINSQTREIARRAVDLNQEAGNGVDSQATGRESGRNGNYPVGNGGDEQAPVWPTLPEPDRAPGSLRNPDGGV